MSADTQLPSDSLSIEHERGCAKCGSSTMYVDCWNCGGEGFSSHDCGEDVCFCLHPEDNVKCDICNGEGGWLACFSCNPGAFDDAPGGDDPDDDGPCPDRRCTGF